MGFGWGVLSNDGEGATQVARSMSTDEQSAQQGTPQPKVASLGVAGDREARKRAAHEDLQPLKVSTRKDSVPLTRSALMRRFNQSFPPFYSQFVSSEVQAQNLRLAYTLYQTRKAVVQVQDEGRKTVVCLAYRNRPSLLSDLFGVFTAFNLSVHGIHLYGQIYSPHLVFIRTIVSRDGHSLSSQTKLSLERAIHECLAGVFRVHETLALEFDLKAGLKEAQVSFYFDPVFHLPTLLVDVDNQPGAFYRVMTALAQEDLTVVNLNLMLRRKQTRFIFYLLGPDSTPTMPEFLGQKLALSIQQRLQGDPA
ncbi:hypothetical protein ACVWZF_001956 [Thermostichus sp. OS-CIW-30]